MHKDKPPSWFDFPARSRRHAISMGLAVGFLLSFFTRAGIVIWRSDPDGARRGMEAAGPMMTAHHKEPDKATPPPPAALGY